MSEMGKYCKAYQLEKFRKFPGWSEKAENAKKEKTIEKDREIEKFRNLEDSSILYLQENFVVTDGIFIDENIIFDNVSPEWITYCRKNLKFEIPGFAREKPQEG
jgi:hypothetical protein